MRRVPQSHLARQLGKSEHWVSRCLNGHVPVPDSFKTGVAAILGLPVEACFYDDQPSKAGAS